jgi:predicted SprT family Zn-dependent metalloprotease
MGPVIPPPPGNDLAVVRAYALSVLKTFGLADWRFRYNRRVRSLGLCRFGPRTIELSAHLVRRNGPEEIRETLLHEVAHALAGPGHNHVAVWRAKCAQVGCRPERCGAADMPPGRWRADCAACRAVFHRHRRPRPLSGWFCRGCGRERGRLAWSCVPGEPAA